MGSYCNRVQAVVTGGMAKRKKRSTTVEPTPEQYATGDFYRAGMAYRRNAVIDTLSQSGKLSARQHYGLSRYRDVLNATERSPMRDSLDKAAYGRSGGAGTPLGDMRTRNEINRLEDALGPLRDIAYAITFNEQTISQWTMQTSGARERTEKRNGKLVTYMTPRSKAAQANAMRDIQTAGDRVAGAIGA